jgi:carboxyl-terminal processing protease
LITNLPKYKTFYLSKLAAANYLLIAALSCLSQLAPKNSYSDAGSICFRAQEMIKTIQRHHYNAREIDSSFSSFVFDQTLDLLDPNYIFLTEGDVQSLEKYRYDLKSSIDNNNCEFIDELSDVLSKRLVSAEIFYSDHLTGKFNYREEDKFVFY